MAFKIKKQQ